MKIALLEPFFTGSHKQWAEQLSQYSSHEIRIFALPGKFWKWRMHIGAVNLARRTNWNAAFQDGSPDMFLATSMLDVSTFRSLLQPEHRSIPIGMYFHENQLSYPWSPTDPDPTIGRDNHYGFIQFTSALAADKLWFNSAYHRDSFLKALPDFLRQFPDEQPLELIDTIEAKSEVLHLGLDLPVFSPVASDSPIFLWNHRWEYDKNPELFFESLIELAKQGLDFKLIVVGEQFEKAPPIFVRAKSALADKILHWGYCQDLIDYHAQLQRATHLPVTSNQDFFGISVVEAIAAGVTPILPRDLAYPEHVGDVGCFYQRTQFIEALKASFRNTLERKTYRIDIEKYDWKNQIDLYDRAFGRLLEVWR
jgi:glycosyltransferase involved in cell wall biosynthesis